MKLIESILGDIELVGETGSWQIAASSEIPETGLELIHLKLSSQEAAVPPKIVLEFSTPQVDMHTRWYPQDMDAPVREVSFLGGLLHGYRRETLAA